MENLIEPNIHPLLVHFAIALTMMASVSYALARLAQAPLHRPFRRPANRSTIASPLSCAPDLRTVCGGFGGLACGGAF